MARVVVLALVLLAGLVASVPLLAAPALALDNTGFETAGPDGTPRGWRAYLGAFGQAQLSLDRQLRSAGQSSLRVQVGDKTRCAVTQLISVPQGGTYTFSCRVRMATPPSTVVQLQVEWFQTVDWPRRLRLVTSETPTPLVGEAADWTELGATGTKPADADLALVAIIVGNGQTPPGTVWVDEARWRPGAFPAPLVANGGFESDADRDGQPDGWGPAMYGGGFDLGRDDTVAHTGKASARLTGAKDHGDRSCYYLATPVFPPPGKVRLSYWYKGTGVAALIMHLLTPAGVQKPGGGIEYGVMSATPPLTGEWQQFSQEIVVPAEAKQAGTMRLDIILYQKGEGTLWYDDVQVELAE